jgi:hypothetical protein
MRHLYAHGLTFGVNDARYPLQDPSETSYISYAPVEFSTWGDAVIQYFLDIAWGGEERRAIACLFSRVEQLVIFQTYVNDLPILSLEEKSRVH